jgi:hypothetical protein
MRLALLALAAVLLLALLLVGKRRVTEVKPNLVEVRPVPMVIEPEWSEPAIDNRLAPVVTEPVMQATKSRPGWLSRNKYKVGLGGLMLLSVASRMNNWSTWKSMPRPSFSNFQAKKYQTKFAGAHKNSDEATKYHFAPAYDVPTITPRDMALYNDLEEPDWTEWG